jgi:hypothetical protein
MTNSTTANVDVFTRVFAGIAVVGPFVLLTLASMRPLGSRGDLIVSGHIFLVAALTTALLLRGVYRMGFSHARRLLTRGIDRSLTA